MTALDRLNPRQSDVLRQLIDASAGISRQDLDGRVVRALVSRGLAEERDGGVHASARARQQFRELKSGNVEGRERSLATGALSAAQHELLLRLSRRAEPVAEDEIDGRSLRALSARGFVRKTSRGVEVTEAGREANRRLGEPRSHGGRRRGRPRREHPRAESILRAVGVLENVVPSDSELLVGPIMCHIDDVLFGLRRFARQLKEGR